MVEIDRSEEPRDTFLHRAADSVGAVSMGLGGLLLVSPHSGGRLLGLEKTPQEVRRALGATDAALGAAILAARGSRRRWVPVCARSLLHLAFAREYRRSGHDMAAGAMCVLFLLDASIAIGLRRRGGR